MSGAALFGMSRRPQCSGRRSRSGRDRATGLSICRLLQEPDTSPATVARCHRSSLCTASERDVQKAGAINALLVRPIDVLPQKAGDPIRPFAVGIFNEIRALLKPDVGVTRLRRVIAVYVRLKRYYFASAQPDSMRHDLAGAPVEPVSAADRLEAQRRFLEMKRTRMQPEVQAAVSHVAGAPEPTKNDLIRAALLKRRSLATK